eukprot:2789898-Amphidinium_carterae.2
MGAWTSLFCSGPSNAAEEVEKRKNTELQKLLLAGTKAHQDDKWDTAEEYYTKVLEAVGLQISAAEPLGARRNELRKTDGFVAIKEAATSSLWCSGLDGIPTNANVAEALHLLGALRIQRQVAAGDAADSDDEDHHAAQRSPTRTLKRINISETQISPMPPIRPGSSC